MAHFPRKHVIPKVGHQRFGLRICSLRISNLDEGFPKPQGVGEGADTGLTTDFVISAYTLRIGGFGDETYKVSLNTLHH